VRNALWSLILMAAAILAVVVLLPVLGVLFLGVALLLALGIGAILAAPFLAKLPWFRDRIHVQTRGSARSVRFGQNRSYPGAMTGERERIDSAARTDPGDVIDVEGREIPDRENRPE
jgi:hypothetical protein